MRFKQAYYNDLNYCITKYLSNNYERIHLRLEDNWVYSF